MDVKYYDGRDLQGFWEVTCVYEGGVREPLCFLPDPNLEVITTLKDLNPDCILSLIQGDVAFLVRTFNEDEDVDE